MIKYIPHLQGNISLGTLAFLYPLHRYQLSDHARYPPNPRVHKQNLNRSQRQQAHFVSIFPFYSEMVPVILASQQQEGGSIAEELFQSLFMR